ncbi:hypothetical protein AYI68_g2085 [Smittium mucronatum]|uniref:RGS domain-containing protein n=1 Tax=Smittium mucronatum TaxID=133383 RepID=A0A1R0H3Q2_9FUNG|nr:hypothetical protein AYI68_g2085 [Smittium mucronatum]
MMFKELSFLLAVLAITFTHVHSIDVPQTRNSTPFRLIDTSPKVPSMLSLNKRSVPLSAFPENNPLNSTKIVVIDADSATDSTGNQTVSSTVEYNHESDLSYQIREIYQTIKVAKHAAWFSIIGVWSVIFVISTVMYMKLSAHTQESKFKSRTIVFCVVVSGYIFTVHAMATEALNPYYPCVLRIFIGYPTLFIFSISLILRSILYASQVRMILLKNEISALLSQSEKENNNKSLVFDDSKAKTDHMQLSFFSRFLRLVTNSTYSQNTQDKLLEVQYRINMNNRVLDFLRDRNYLIFVVISLVVAFSIFGYFSTYSLYGFRPVSYGCPAKITTPLIPLYTVIFICVGCVPPVFFLTIGFKDAYGIQAELFVTMMSTLILVTGLVVYNQFVPVTKIVYASGYVIVLPLFFIQHYMMVILPLVQLRKLRQHRPVGKLFNSSGGSTANDRIPVGHALATSSKKEQFEGILAYPAGFVRLSKAAEETFCPENVNFLQDYQLLKFKVCSLITSDSNDNEANNKYFDDELASESQQSDRYSVGPDIETRQESKSSYQKSLLLDTHSSHNLDPKLRVYGSEKFNNSSLSIDEIQDELDLEMLLGGEFIPPLPVTIADSVYRMGLMLDLQLLNDSEGRKERNTPKFTQIPLKLNTEFYKFYYKYIHKDALLAVNITTKAVGPIENAIRGEKYTLGMFDDALDEVLNNLYTNTYPIMLKTL